MCGQHGHRKNILKISFRVFSLFGGLFSILASGSREERERKGSYMGKRERTDCGDCKETKMEGEVTSRRRRKLKFLRTERARASPNLERTTD